MGNCALCPANASLSGVLCPFMSPTASWEQGRRSFIGEPFPWNPTVLLPSLLDLSASRSRGAFHVHSFEFQIENARFSGSSASKNIGSRAYPSSPTPHRERPNASFYSLDRVGPTYDFFLAPAALYIQHTFAYSVGGGKKPYIDRMGIHGAKRSSSNPPCPHMRGGEVPVCWDCTEEGRIIKPPGPAEGTATPPTWQKFGRLRGSFRIGDGNRYKGTTTVSPARRTHASDTGTHLPEAGLEVVKPDHRRSQPGLEVFVGPRTVSPEDKFIRSEPKNLGAEATPVPKYEAASNAESTVGSSTAVEPTRRIWGLRGRPCWILVVIAILALVGIVVGVAVGVTQRQAAQ